MPDEVFFAYPGSPDLLAETVRDGAREIDRIGIVDTELWENLKIAGRVLLSQITASIDRSVCLAAEISHLNENVMFEIGYAIAVERRVWLLLDTSLDIARSNWRDFGLLRGIGYTAYRNVGDISEAFADQLPHLSDTTPFETLLAPSFEQDPGPSLFIIPSVHDTEPNRQLTRIAQREHARGLRVVIADYSESALYPFGWYAQEVYSADAVVVHFTSRERTGAHAYNARSAFIAGLAHGMNRPLLMLGDEGYESPVDYEHLLRTYSTTEQCKSVATGWIGDHLAEARGRAARIQDRSRRLRLATDLSQLRLGEHVAEHESEQLSEYFVETAPYRRTLEAQTLVFVGRKGSGKTANMLTAASTLSADRRNLVCVLKPQSYELQAVVRLFAGYEAVDVRNYVAASLWRYLCVTDVARTAAAAIQARPAGAVPGSAEWELVEFMSSEADSLGQDFAVRLERSIAELGALDLPHSIEGARDYVNEALHVRLMARLRDLLTPVLAEYSRVAILIDNLDKAWEPSADLSHLSSVLFGLLTGSGRLVRDLVRPEVGRALHVSMAIFMRADIFAEVSKLAREPDKMPVVQLTWDDPDLLLRLVEERYAAQLDRAPEEDELWSRYFVDAVGGMPTKSYVLGRILPRPRDLIFYCNSAIFSAINARREKVTEKDIEVADKEYSQFAVGSLRVENGITLRELDDVFLSFMGESAIMAHSRVVDVLASALPQEKVNQALDHLRVASFLGTEVRADDFRYVEHSVDLARVDALSGKYTTNGGGERRYQVHPAYRPYLEIAE